MSTTKSAPPSDPEIHIIPKVWITQYALTKGIYTAENAEFRAEYDGMITIHRKGYRVYFHNPHWHATEEAALAQVKRMIAAARKSIAKRLAKLDNYNPAIRPLDQ